MVNVNGARRVLIGAACIALAGCAGVQPVAYSGIDSSSYLKTNTHDTSGRIPYRYSTQVDWRSYTKVIVDPVTVYRGADGQFGDLRDTDKTALADYMKRTFVDKLGKRFVVSSEASPNTMRVKLTLTGAETTTPFLGPVSRFDIAGGLYNGVQAIRGGKGSFTGSITYAVEVFDASTGRLLDAYVTKQYPNAMNIGAAFGSLGAAKTGIDKGADAFLAGLN
ncbi:DUF3313 domain-containing protein [Paraburkholderia sp.]|uniref:DUF3313 domain-containing protein n=1 Tax=Paraburkholderia sp. TaxID=1926495 RepID=UPI003D6E3F31